MKCPTCRHTALAHSPPTPPTQRPRRTTGRPSHRLVPHPRPLCVPAPARKLVHGSRVARVRLPERGRGGRCLSYAWFAPRPIIDVLCSRHHSLRRGCHAWLRRKKLYRRRRVRCRCVPRGDRGRDRSRWGLLSTRFASPILNRRGPLCFDSGHGGGGVRGQSITNSDIWCCQCEREGLGYTGIERRLLGRGPLSFVNMMIAEGLARVMLSVGRRCWFLAYCGGSTDTQTRCRGGVDAGLSLASSCSFYFLFVCEV